MPALRPLSRLWIASFALLALLLVGCAKRQPKIPGESDIEIEKLEILSAQPGELALEHGDLFARLGQRKGALTSIAGRYSVFREAEDRRRIEAFWQQFGYLDVEVTEDEPVFNENHTKVSLAYRVKENTRYAMDDAAFEHLPEDPALQAQLYEYVPFKKGSTEIDLEAFRKSRVEMQEFLKREGYGHANVYSRAYIDKSAKVIHWFYFVDAGPPTRIASIAVEGNHRVPAEEIIRRSGLKVGDPYKETLRDTVVRDLLDTGAFASAFLRMDTDTKFIPPGTAPDTGGELRDEQVDANGKFVPRALPPDVNVTIHVVEAPRVTMRVRGSFELDPSRADTALGLRFFFRDLFAPLHHLVVEGRVGYGWLFDQPATESPNGIYGEGLIRSVHNGVLGRLGDMRVTAHYKSDLFPGYYLHHFEGGPGVRTTFTTGLFFDVDLFAKYSHSIGYGPFSPATTEHLSLPTGEESYGPELQTSLVWDARDNPVEAMRGGLIALNLKFSPGAPIATHRYFNVAPDFRAFIPLGKKLAIGLRASGGWSFGSDEEGVPLDARLFGGGTYGMRGYSRDQLSPRVAKCITSPDGISGCRRFPVGGLSLVETSAELRFLPVQKPYGFVGFVDFGGASGDLNPFANEPSLDAGLGVRLRLWYLPANVDVAYAILREGDIQGIDDGPFRVFFRIGEAF
ncbi:MAG: BamA/TamA family outer membrane protein [Polyangiaceae bacterium]